MDSEKSTHTFSKNYKNFMFKNIHMCLFKVKEIAFEFSLLIYFCVLYVLRKRVELFLDQSFDFIFLNVISKNATTKHNSPKDLLYKCENRMHIAAGKLVCYPLN